MSGTEKTQKRIAWKQVFTKYRCQWTDYNYSFPQEPTFQLDVNDNPIYAVRTRFSFALPRSIIDKTNPAR
jgi:hypothetical protein